MILYLDTSALAKLYVEEEGRELVREAVESAERVATSTVAYAEARAALARQEREGVLDREQHRRSVEALDGEWRGFVRLTVSNLIAYRAGEMAEKHALCEASTPSTWRAPCGSGKGSPALGFWPSMPGSWRRRGERRCECTR